MGDATSWRISFYTLPGRPRHPRCCLRRIPSRGGTNAEFVVDVGGHQCLPAGGVCVPGARLGNGGQPDSVVGGSAQESQYGNQDRGRSISLCSVVVVEVGRCRQYCSGPQQIALSDAPALCTMGLLHAAEPASTGGGEPGRCECALLRPEKWRRVQSPPVTGSMLTSSKTAIKGETSSLPTAR